MQVVILQTLTALLNNKSTVALSSMIRAAKESNKLRFSWLLTGEIFL